MHGTLNHVLRGDVTPQAFPLFKNVNPRNRKRIIGSQHKSKSMNLLPIIEQFTEQIASGQIEIYNEVSAQCELAILLRQRLGTSCKIQLERDISYFNLENKDGESFEKTEMDIAVFDPEMKEKHCIELKYPLYGRVPVQMFRACKDIKFLEQLVLSGFDKSYFVMFAEDNAFYSDEGDSGICKSFRKDKLIGNMIVGTSRDVNFKKLFFKGKYPIKWKSIVNSLKYFVVEV
jgi:hypothetical protein